MNNEKFKIADTIKKMIIDFDNYITNFPKKELELKRKLYDTIYDMLEVSYEANATYDKNKRNDLIDKLICKIKFLDFCINRCYEHNIINQKKYLKFGDNLGYILSLTINWRKFNISGQGSSEKS